MTTPRAAPRGSALPDAADVVALLARPGAWPEEERTRPVEVVETHMSWVFLTARHAYKLKKPIRYDVLDFRTLAARRHFCREELRLNRRLAPRVYLGTLPLARDPGGRLAVGGGGPSLEWLVWMRRLPRERMLDHLVERGAAGAGTLRRVGRVLARFYRRAEPEPLAPEAYRRRLAEGLRADRRELLRPDFGLRARDVERAVAAVESGLDRAAPLLAQRVREGRIVEGHGDLRPEHVCVLDEPVVIDCLEFERDFRIVDPADELAFLALECERLGAAGLGDVLFAVHAEETGDRPPDALRPLYRGLRALRRAKLAVWHLRDDGVRDPERWREKALWYLAAAAAGGP